MLDNKINKSDFVNKFREVCYVSYNNWWAERNGGNLSYLLDDEMVKPYIIDDSYTRSYKLKTPAAELANKYFLVTGSGRFYRLISQENLTSQNAGIVQIDADGKGYHIVWGFENDTKPTSELPSHLQSHISRLKVNPTHRVVIHSHPTNIVALTFTEELDELTFTRKLWEMISESSVVFPEGLGIIPWMIPGSEEIGQATAEKMKQYRIVIWPHHGIFCAGESLDEALGLLEIIEKSAKIYMRILQTGKPILQKITKENFDVFSKAFNVTLNPKVFSK